MAEVANNAAKNLLASAVTSAGALLLAVAGSVSWRETASLLVGSVSGGVVGVQLASRLSAAPLRVAVVVLGGVFTASYVVKYNLS